MLTQGSKWARCVPAAERIPEYIGMAFRHALEGRPGPVFLEIPVDLLFQSVDEQNVVWPAQHRAYSRPWEIRSACAERLSCSEVQNGLSASEEVLSGGPGLHPCWSVLPTPPISRSS